MSHSKAKSQINLEIEQINELLEKYKELLDNVKTKDPDLVEITAIASILHSFYNGIENMFLVIAKYIDREVPDGIHWHKDLLLNMTKTAIYWEEWAIKYIATVGIYPAPS